MLRAIYEPTLTVGAAYPKFNVNQQVRFAGGTGTIRHYQPDSGTWSYVIEMELGPEPDIGRIGFETTIWLTESEILGGCG